MKGKALQAVLSTGNKVACAFLFPARSLSTRGVLACALLCRASCGVCATIIKPTQLASQPIKTHCRQSDPTVRATATCKSDLQHRHATRRFRPFGPDTHPAQAAERQCVVALAEHFRRAFSHPQDDRRHTTSAPRTPSAHPPALLPPHHQSRCCSSPDEPAPCTPPAPPLALLHPHRRSRSSASVDEPAPCTSPTPPPARALPRPSHQLEAHCLSRQDEPAPGSRQAPPPKEQLPHHQA
eukprot:3756650-Rhodomonas_salina.2